MLSARARWRRAHTPLMLTLRSPGQDSDTPLPANELTLFVGLCALAGDAAPLPTGEAEVDVGR